MNLYIEIENGQPKNHPALEENLMQVFGNIPQNWEPFIRGEPPIPTVYQVLESFDSVYTKVNTVWTDVWSVRDMTSEEKTSKQQQVIDSFNSRDQASNWSAWNLDEETCIMVPPIPRPEPDQAKLDQRIMTFWSGADANWKDTPVRPEGNYKFDFIAWQWVQVV
jgi:hypothetical protein